MNRRTQRFDLSVDRPALLAALGEYRRAVVGASTKAKAGGALYHGCCAVVGAIDALVTLLTGSPYYFHEPVRRAASDE